MVEKVKKNIKVEKPGKKRFRLKLPFLNNYIVIGAAIVILMIIIISIAAPLIAPFDPNAQDLGKSLQGMSYHNWFGTDRQGRDILSRVIYGGRTVLLGALMIVIVSVVIGVPLGLISGYFGGKTDTLIMRTCDVILAFPALLLAFVIVAVFGRGLKNTVIAIGIVYIPMIARLVRSVTLIEKEQTYVEAAKALGISDSRILFKHILINCMSPVLIQVTVDFAYAIIDLATMSFLGLGVQPPTADWGSMLDEGREYLLISPNTCIASGVAIIVTVVAFNLLSDGLQAYFDPKQRKSSNLGV